MISWKSILLDTIKLSDEVKRLNNQNEKMTDKVNEMDIRLSKIEERLKVYSEIQTLQKPLK
ncbi:hypothetical protein SPONN_2690 [uncultured Candidatus Thioglobus sp.]|nr:hypothetical protein SPONN_2690 [uncultured Candidatus Thioglobus sp.]